MQHLEVIYHFHDITNYFINKHSHIHGLSNQTDFTK